LFFVSGPSFSLQDFNIPFDVSVDPHDPNAITVTTPDGQGRVRLLRASQQLLLRLETSNGKHLRCHFMHHHITTILRATAFLVAAALFWLFTSDTLDNRLNQAMILNF
jgi:hypothetical protein